MNWIGSVIVNSILGYNVEESISALKRSLANSEHKCVKLTQENRSQKNELDKCKKQLEKQHVKLSEQMAKGKQYRTKLMMNGLQIKRLSSSVDAHKTTLQKLDKQYRTILIVNGLLVKKMSITMSDQEVTIQQLENKIAKDGSSHILKEDSLKKQLEEKTALLIKAQNDAKSRLDDYKEKEKKIASLIMDLDNLKKIVENKSLENEQLQRELDKVAKAAKEAGSTASNELGDWSLLFKVWRKILN